MSADQLRNIARCWFGMCDDGSLHPDDADWTQEDFPVHLLPPPPQGWEHWWFDEVQMVYQYPELSHWSSFVTVPSLEPIIVSIDGAKVQIWDGWHRSAAAVVAGRSTIVAVVGRRRDYE